MGERGADVKKCSFCGELVPDDTVICRWCGRKQTPTPALAEEKMTDKPKGIFCYSCGTQLPAGANFCWNCGKSQKMDTQLNTPEWETCMISYEGVKQSGWFGPGKARWWAKASGPKGNYRAGESTPFQAGVFDQEVTLPTGTHHPWFREVTMALDALTNKLLTDGWEPSMPYGAMYWNLRFRRRIR
jgi:RNA polymerase subunit RPABC4/transcription elongation factor Spt4